MAERTWQDSKRILVILAHPDDPEFFCGATLARWAMEGHHIIYWLLTCGDKGAADGNIDPNALCVLRHQEQLSAAAVLGVKQVNFLGYPDGYLVPDLKLRQDITRIIRLEKPDILVTCDPETFMVGDSRINHPDHRAAGQAALDAVFPAAGNPLYFPELLRDQGLEPHSVKEVWVSLTLNPNVRIDATEYWGTKLLALCEHKSQIGDPEAFKERMINRRTADSTPESPRYEEVFKVIRFS